MGAHESDEAMAWSKSESDSESKLNFNLLGSAKFFASGCDSIRFNLKTFTDVTHRKVLFEEHNSINQLPCCT